MREPLDAFEVTAKPPDNYPFLSPGGLWLHLVVSGEQFDLMVTQDGVEESSEELTERLQSELQDWIAESRFAWGEHRVPAN